MALFIPQRKAMYPPMHNTATLSKTIKTMMITSFSYVDKLNKEARSMLSLKTQTDM